MSNKLADRINSYQITSDFKLLPRLPIIISVNGRGFSKLTSLLDKPYDEKLAECFLSTMLRLCSDIEGVVFAFAHNDEIVLVLRNDQHPDTLPWFDNKIQKIVSISSSIATVHFNQCATAVDLNLMGEGLFTSQVYVVPNIVEAINSLVFKQQHNFHTSIQFASFYELLKKYNKDEIKQMLMGLSIDERIDLLHQECEIDFNLYPMAFRRGVGCYKVPRVSDSGSKTKWHLNNELPIFTKDTAFLKNIFGNGVDIR
jgi:tRNA(His) guanylyltransferase